MLGLLELECLMVAVRGDWYAYFKLAVYPLLISYISYSILSLKNPFCVINPLLYDVKNLNNSLLEANLKPVFIL